jgi:hypothetical protein
MNSNKRHACPECAKRFRCDNSLADHRRDVHGIEKLDVRPSNHDADLQPVCVECGNLGELVTGKEIYPHRRDLHAKGFFLCRCGAYCGCHPNTDRPLGFPCGPETRRARSAAHAAFDPLWKAGGWRRWQAYQWLAKKMNMDAHDCHIGMMTADQARQVVEIVNTQTMAVPQPLEAA